MSYPVLVILWIIWNLNKHIKNRQTIKENRVLKRTIKVSKKEKIKSRLGAILIFGVLAVLQIYFIRKGFYSISADEAGHTLEAYGWYNGDYTLFSIWLPFLKIFYGSLFHIHYDLFWLPRVFSMLFGIMALCALMLLSYELFKNKFIVLITGFLGSIFTGIAIFSVLPLTEIYFFFFLVISIYLLLNYLRTKERLWLLYACGVVLTTIRYEGWVFVFIMALILFTKLNYKVLGLFIFPAFWVILSYAETGSLFGFVSNVAARRRALTFQDTVLYNFLYIGVNSLALLGLIYLRKNKIYFWLFLGSLIIWFLGTSTSGAMATHNVWRVGLVWNVLLIPFVAYLIHKIYLHSKAFSVLVLIVISYLFVTQTLTYGSKSYTKFDDMTAGNQIKNLNGKFLIPRYGWEYTNLLITSQQPNKFIDKEKITYSDLDSCDYFISLEVINSNRLSQIYKNNKWIIYQVEGE